MKGSKILVATPARGVYEDIVVEGTPKPGTVMELTSTAPVGNVFEYAVYGTAAHSIGQYVENDGDRKAIAILMEKEDEGKIFSDSYVDGDRARVYFPAMGEQFNMYINDVSGTGDDMIVSTELMVEDGTGQLITADSDAQAHPFTSLEVATNPTADFWLWCRFNGEGGA